MKNSRGFAFTFVRDDDCTMNAEYLRRCSRAEGQNPLAYVLARGGGHSFRQPHVVSLSLPRTQAIAIATRRVRWPTHNADECLIYNALRCDACFSIAEGDKGQAVAPGVRAFSYRNAKQNRLGLDYVSFFMRVL